MNKRFLACVLSLAMLMTTLSAPAFAANEGETVVAKIGDTQYTDLQEAIQDAKIGGTVELVADTVIDVWNQVWDCDGLTINGGGHTVTIHSISSGVNGNYILFNAKNLTVSDLNVILISGNGFDLNSGSLKNVTVTGGKYAVATGGNSAPGGSAAITIDSCTFNGQQYSIYTNERAAGYDLVVNNCTFDSNRPIIIRTNEVFTNNTVTTSEKLTVDSGATATITGNTFTEGSTIKLYNVPDTKIEKNTLSKIEASSDAKANLDGNYWYGNEPGSLPNGITAATYYTDAAMETLTVTSGVVAKIGDTYYSSVTTALNKAADGATVEVIASTDEAVTMPLKSVTLQGTGDATLTGGIKFAAGEVPENTAVTIEGLTFDGRGIELTGWSSTKNSKNFASVVICNNTFKNVEVYHNGALQSIYAIHFNNEDDAVNGLEIKDNTFLNNRIGGIGVAGVCGTAVITGNTIQNSGMNALYLLGKDSKGNAANSITIANNIFSEWGLSKNAKGEYEGRAMRLLRFADGAAVDMTGNVFSCEAAPEEYIKATEISDNSTVNINECYWGGSEPTNGKGAGVNIYMENTSSAAVEYKAITYYKDAEKEQLVNTSNVVAKIGDTYYTDLLTAIKAAEENATITLLQDAEINEASNAGANIDKSLTIEGGNHTITTNASRIFRVVKNGATLTLNNMKLTGANAERAIQADPDVAGVTFNINNCDMAANSYAINLCLGADNTTVNITNSNITSWAVLNVWSSQTTINVTGSNLTGINPHTGSTDNFATLVINRGVKDSVVNITNSTVKAITQKGNYQKIINIQDGDHSNTSDPSSPTGNVVTFTGCTFETEGTLNDGTPLQPMYYAKGGNTLVMDGKTMYIPEKTGELEENAEVEINLIPVAKIGDIYFGDLQTAVEAAKPGDTITLLGNINFETTAETKHGYLFDKNLTLDLNGHKLSMSGDAAAQSMGLIQVASGAKLTLCDTAEVKGCVEDNSTHYGRTHAARVEAGAEMIIDKSATVYGRIYAIGISVSDNSQPIPETGGAKLTVNGTIDVTGKTKLSGTKDYTIPAIMGNGSMHGTDITITGMVKSPDSIAIYHPQYGTLTVDGGHVEGAAGIGIKSGILNIINNATVIGTADDDELSDAHSVVNGINNDGSALVIDSHVGYAGKMDITIANSTVKSLHAHAVKEIKSSAATNSNVVSFAVGGASVIEGKISLKDIEKAVVTGGQFSDELDIAVTIPEGFKEYESNGKYYVVPAFTVTATANPAQVNAGDEVKVTVAATGAVNYTNADWKLRYDPTKLTLTGQTLADGAEGSADNYVLSGKIETIGTTNGDEIASGTALATYTFTAVGQTTTPVTTAVEFMDAHVDTYDMAVLLTSVPAKTENTEVEIVIDNTNTIKGTLQAQTIAYDGKAHMANAFVPAEGMTGAIVTYSTEEDGTYTTTLPSFTQVGAHDVWYRATLAGYQTTVAKAEGAVVITPKAVTAGVELAAGAVYPEVTIRPVINGVADRTFTGTVTVGIDGKTFTFAAADFVFDGNGTAILAADKAQRVSLSRGGAFDITAAYTAGTGDNYTGGETSTTQVNVDLAFADEATVKALTAAVTNEFVYDGTAHGVTVADTLPDGWAVKSITAFDGTDSPTVTNVADAGVFVQVTFTDNNGRYNNVTVNTILTVTPAAATITIGDFAKAFGAEDAAIAVKDGSTAVAVTGLIADGDLGTITAVRSELGEDRGTYAMTAGYTPNSNYTVTVVNGKLEIGAPDYLIEVVDNALLHGGDHNSDYVAGYKLILVYTDADRSYFTYNGKQMYDVTENGYRYVAYSNDTATQSDKEYRHVFGIVVKGDDGAAADYRAKVRYTTDTAAQPERIVYDMDVNFDSIYDINDISAANGVYNALYADVYARNMLKADANGDKYVDTKDVELVKARVEK